MSKTQNTFPWMGIALAINFLLIVVITVTCYFMWSRPRVVYFDSGKLLSGYEGMKDAKASVDQKVGLMRANLDTLRQEAELALKKVESFKGPMVKRQFLAEIAQGKQVIYQNYQNNLNSMIRETETKTVDAMLVSVTETIKDYAARKGYDLVLTGSQNGNIIYNNRSIDITDELLELVNSKYSQGRL